MNAFNPDPSRRAPSRLTKCKIRRNHFLTPSQKWGVLRICWRVLCTWLYGRGGLDDDDDDDINLRPGKPQYSRPPKGYRDVLS